jgi:hypothetical protein
MKQTKNQGNFSKRVILAGITLAQQISLEAVVY